MTALLFPGQSTQRVGMGRALFHASPEARVVLAEATRATAVDVPDLLRRGPSARLRRTEYAQIAVTTVNLAALAVLKARRIPYDIVAGHSVGALAALAAAGALTPERALRLAARRGALMGAVPEAGAMAAVTGLAPADVDAVVRRVAARTGRPLVTGLVNAADRTVVSGAEQAVAEAIDALLAVGAHSAVPLEVSHAFHSPLMAAAAPAWERTVAEVPLREARVPVVADTTGRPLTTPEDLRAYLVDQLTGPVRWDLVGRSLTDAGVTDAVETGDSKVLRSFGRDHPAVRITSMAQPHVLARLRADGPAVAHEVAVAAGSAP